LFGGSEIQIYLGELAGVFLRIGPPHKYPVLLSNMWKAPSGYLCKAYQRGFDGRLGLHVADSAALNIYRHIHGKCEGTLCFSERTGVEGSTPRYAYDSPKTYLETTEAGATRWLEEYRRE
jgi:hypothetical protein